MLTTGVAAEAEVNAVEAAVVLPETLPKSMETVVATLSNPTSEKLSEADSVVPSKAICSIKKNDLSAVSFAAEHPVVCEARINFPTQYC